MNAKSVAAKKIMSIAGNVAANVLAITIAARMFVAAFTLKTMCAVIFATAKGAIWFVLFAIQIHLNSLFARN